MVSLTKTLEVEKPATSAQSAALKALAEASSQSEVLPTKAILPSPSQAQDATASLEETFVNTDDGHESESFSTVKAPAGSGDEGEKPNVPESMTSRSAISSRPEVFPESTALSSNGLGVEEAKTEGGPQSDSIGDVMQPTGQQQSVLTKTSETDSQEFQRPDELKPTGAKGLHDTPLRRCQSIEAQIHSRAQGNAEALMQTVAETRMSYETFKDKCDEMAVTVDEMSEKVDTLNTRPEC